MNGRFYLMMSLFFMFLFLFCVEEFSVHSFIARASTDRLISKKDMAGYPNKVILAIIDSLRYDYLTKIPFFEAINTRFPSKSFLIKCKVGNPTMTTQRVESLMTGSEIFSSANIFKSFFASKLQTDNIISQLNLQNKTSIIFGDDTWAKLFEFTAEKTCVNTYNVHDYDSCDKLIYENMMVRMKQASYDFMVAHFLALDHIGHSKGRISGDIMLEKMMSISDFLKEIAQKMDNQTILFVTGDHGMKNDGNHGGSSKQQTETILFGYSKQTQFVKSKNQKIVQQSDLTAIISMYLGVNLPSNAVGIPFFEALPANLSKQAKLEVLDHSLQQLRELFGYYNLQFKDITSFQQNVVRQNNIQSLLDEVRKYKYRLQFLKYSSQNTTFIIGILLFLTIVAAMALLAIYQQIRAKFLINLSFFTNFLYHCNIFLLSFTLFSVYFSWGLTKISSQILLITIITSLILSFSYSKLRNSAYMKKISIALCCIIVICQVEPQKIGQYIKNPLCINILHKTLQMVSTKIFFYCLLIWRIWSLQIKVSRTRQVYSNYLIILLSAIQFIFSCLKTPIYALRIAIIAITMIKQIICIFFQEPKSKHRGILILTVIMLMFLGEFGSIILLCCIELTKIVIQTNINPIFLSFYSEAVWWFMGNRFQYSGIDVVKSYIFSETYSPMMNGLSMLFYIISPQLTVFLLMNILREDFIQVTHQDRNDTFQIISEEQVSQTSKNFSCQYNQYACNKETMLLGNTQFIIIPLQGLLSCAWNVFHNNQKILFTVLYIPMFLFCIIKTISTFFMIVITNFFINRTLAGPQKLRL